MKILSREEYIKCLASKRIDILFWLVVIISILITLFLPDHRVIMAELIEILAISILQLLVAIASKHSFTKVSYQNKKISSEKFAQTMASYRVINIFIVASIVVWIATLLLSKYVAINSTLVISSMIFACQGMLVIIGTISALVSYSMKLDSQDNKMSLCEVSCFVKKR